MGEEIHIRRSVLIVAHQLERFCQAGFLLKRHRDIRGQLLDRLLQHRDDGGLLVVPDRQRDRPAVPVPAARITGTTGQQQKDADQQQTQALTHDKLLLVKK